MSEPDPSKIENEIRDMFVDAGYEVDDVELSDVQSPAAGTEVVTIIVKARKKRKRKLTVLGVKVA